jgi:hypothetical protein
VLDGIGAEAVFVGTGDVDAEGIGVEVEAAVGKIGVEGIGLGNAWLDGEGVITEGASVDPVLTGIPDKLLGLMVGSGAGVIKGMFGEMEDPGVEIEVFADKDAILGIICEKGALAERVDCGLAGTITFVDAGACVLMNRIYI